MVAAIFLAAAVVGTLSVRRFVAAGGRPFFYQTYFEPAVMTACGRGFVISEHQPPGLAAFLAQQRDRFSCTELPPDLRVGTTALVQGPWRYLMTTVAMAWMLLGISWSGLTPLFGVFFGSTAACVYMLSRQITGRAAAAACALFMCLSPLQRANLPNLRDYAKAPFMMALAAILVALVVRPRRARDIVLLSLGYGVVMGIGYGFRTDLLIALPPLVVALALFLPSGVIAQLPWRAAAIGVFAIGFVVAAAPILTSVVSRGGCQWHFALLGLTTPFNDMLGVAGGAYNWGHVYTDEYLWAAVTTYAQRFRPDLGFIEYCSHEYDVASFEYARHILQTFPADMVTRAYASALQILDLPIRHAIAIRYPGAAIAAVFMFAIASVNARLATFVLFVVLYFGGLPAIQFLPRHYFMFECITVVMAAFLVDAGARIAAQRRDWPRPDALRRAGIFAAAVALLLVVPLGLLRWYQSGRVDRLLESYVAAQKSEIALATAGPGHYRPEAPLVAHASTEAAAVAAFGSTRGRFLEFDVDPAACAPGTTLTFAYDAQFPVADLTHAATLARSRGAHGATRVFEPIYPGFQGVDVSDPSAACAPKAFVLSGLDAIALWLPAQLVPDWASGPQYQRIRPSP